jgi:hypothetical protein
LIGGTAVEPLVGESKGLILAPWMNMPAGLSTLV